MMPSLIVLSRKKVNRVNASRHGPQLTEQQAAELGRAREHMLARHKLIEAMIRNNELQLRNESARGGAEIELECARRCAARADAGPAEHQEVERLIARFRALQDDHARLVAEREWLNASLLQFDSGPTDDERERSGNA